MEMVNRYSNAGIFRYGFNGKEKDNEDYGEGNNYDYGFRVYNPRIGRFLSVDPILKSFPELSTYQYASNKPIWAIDIDGKEGWELSTPSTRLKQQADLFKISTNRYTGRLELAPNLKTQPVANNQTTITSAPNSYVELRSQQLKAEYERDKSYSGATMDPLAANMISPVANAAGQIAESPIKHGLGMYQGFNEGDKSKVFWNSLGLAMDVSPFLIKGSGAATETFYRTMTAEDAAIFEKTGILPASSETFISPTLSYAQKLKGVTFQINTKPGTVNKLLEIGVSDPTHSLTKPLNLSNVYSGWTKEGAFFKMESDLANGIKPQINIGLGEGKALEIFNQNIVSFKKL